jgi:exportin-1
MLYVFCSLIVFQLGALIYIIQWDSLMAQASQNMDVLSSTDNIKILANVLKTNVSACTSIGSFYLPQLGRIFLDMLGLYKAVSGIVSETIQKEGSFIWLIRQD